MKVAQLIPPSLHHKTSHLDALREGVVLGMGDPYPLEEIEKLEDPKIYKAYLEALQDQTGTILCPDGITRPKVPHSLWWLVEGEVFIGAVSFRHRLNDFLENFGGHIGYGIRPSYQNQGYGKMILKLTLEKARAMGLARVLITATPENIASCRIIEANGGILEDCRQPRWSSKPSNRYWIQL